MPLREYQQQAVDACYRYLREKDGNPCIVCPTGAGKSHIFAQICRDAVELWNGRVLVLTHVRELVEQNAEKIKMLLDPRIVGIFSAGLKQRDRHQPVIVASIQSIHKKACDFEPFQLIITDECHCINTHDLGIYRTFLKDAKIVNPSLRVIGTTATPYRLSSGLICGPENILNEICYEISIKELIRDGYLCPLRSKAGKEKVDTESLHIRGGEFIAGEVETLMDTDNHVKAACAEIVELTQDRQSVLIFASGIAHGRHIVETLRREHGLECGFITGDTPTLERDELIGRFRRQTSGDLLGSAAPLKYLCNVNVLTTGFDAPNIDCVVLLRPTMSPGLYCQMTGRGFRLCEGKTDCLVLDFGGNILRHGPVDGVCIAEVNHGNGDAPVKECPQCNEVIHAAYATCPACGFEFPPPERNNHDGEASSEDILSGKVTMTDYPVRGVYYSVHVKRDKPEGPFSMRVDYEVGWQHTISEWICFEHTGYARHKAEAWWKQRSYEPIPESAEQAVELACDNRIAETTSITVRRVSGEKYDRIVNYQFGEKPEPRIWRDPEPEYAPAFDDSDIPF